MVTTNSIVEYFCKRLVNTIGQGNYISNINEAKKGKLSLLGNDIII